MQIRFYSFSHFLEAGHGMSGMVTMGAVANEYNRQVAFGKYVFISVEKLLFTWPQRAPAKIRAKMRFIVFIHSPGQKR